MSRLVTNGFEVQRLNATYSSDPEAQSCAIVGAPAITTTAAQVRSGEAALSCTTGAARYLSSVQFGGDVTYFWRAAIRWPTTPGANVKVLVFQDGNLEDAIYVQLNTDDTLTLHNKAGNQVGGAASFQGAPLTYYAVEMSGRIPGAGNGTAAMRVDGKEIASSASVNVGNFGIGEFRAGRCENTGPIIQVDDVALNDDVGSSENSWPGTGKVVLMRPTSDAQRSTGWVAGAGGTTNLWSALDATPPAGVALASATNTSQIKNAANNATDTYRAAFPSYATALASGGAGMGTSDTFVYAYGISRIGNSSATGRDAGIGGTGSVNPSFGEITLATAGTAGSEQTGWTTLKTTPTNLSGGAVTPASVPELRVRKATASTDSLMFDLLGIMVEYLETNSLAVGSRTARNTNLRR